MMLKALRWACGMGLAAAGLALADGTEEAAVGRKAVAVADLVLEHHVRPPTRQEMLLQGRAPCTRRPASPSPTTSPGASPGRRLATRRR